MMSEEKLSIKKRFLFGLSAIPDQLTYQAFSLYVFTFFFAVIQLNMLFMWIGFVAWGVWNMINDPMLGALSDRTRCKARWGKRKFFLLISIGPLALMMILLFTVPPGSEVIKFVYFIAVIFVFEFFYTLFDVNVNAIFPEMFPTEDQRTATNVFVKGLTVLGIIFASLPMILLQPLVPGESPTPEELAAIQENYIIAGILLAIITLIAAAPFLLKGIHKETESAECFENRPPFLESLKITLKNRTFIKFTLANLMIWTVFNTLITIIPLYFVFVLGAPDTSAFIITLALVLALIVAALILPVHKFFIKKFGTRNAAMITLASWIILLFPYMFIDNLLIVGVLVTMINGFALSGALMYVDILHGDVIDEDALRYGVKRSASYYGINALIHRFSTILTITVIAFVFNGTGWSEYNPSPGVNTILGLKLIIFLFPAICLGVGILFLKLYSLHGEKLKEMRAEFAKHPELV